MNVSVDAPETPIGWSEERAQAPVQMRFWACNLLVFNLKCICVLAKLKSNIVIIGKPIIVNPVIYIGILFGIWLTYILGYCDIHNSSYEWLKYLSPFEQLGLFLFRSQDNIKYVFWFAIIAHIIESIVSLNYCKKMKLNKSYTLFWFTQTFLLGYPSLRCLISYNIVYQHKISSIKN